MPISLKNVKFTTVNFCTAPSQKICWLSGLQIYYFWLYTVLENAKIATINVCDVQLFLLMINLLPVWLCQSLGIIFPPNSSFVVVCFFYKRSSLCWPIHYPIFPSPVLPACTFKLDERLTPEFTNLVCFKPCSSLPAVSRTPSCFYQLWNLWECWHIATRHVTYRQTINGICRLTEIQLDTDL